LQLGSQRLRLLEQIFCSRACFDRIEHDADALGQLIQKCLVRGAEPLTEESSMTALTFAFKKNRQYHDVRWVKLTQTGTYLRVIAWHIG